MPASYIYHFALLGQYSADPCTHVGVLHNPVIGNHIFGNWSRYVVVLGRLDTRMEGQQEVWLQG